MQVLSLAVREGTGLLCLSGLRRAQLEDIRAAYAAYGVAFDSVETQVRRPGRAPPPRTATTQQNLLARAARGVIGWRPGPQEHRRWRVGAEGEGEWARITGRRRRLTAEERRAAGARWSEAAVS